MEPAAPDPVMPSGTPAATTVWVATFRAVLALTELFEVSATPAVKFR